MALEIQLKTCVDSPASKSVRKETHKGFADKRRIL